MWYRAIFGSLLLSVLELDVDRMSGSVLCLDWDATARVRRLGWCIVYHGTLTVHAESPFLLRRVPNSLKVIIIVFTVTVVQGKAFNHLGLQLIG